MTSLFRERGGLKCLCGKIELYCNIGIKHLIKNNNNNNNNKHIYLTMILIALTKEDFEEVAKTTLGWPSRRKWESKAKDDRFCSCFGAKSDVIATIWNIILPAVILDQDRDNGLSRAAPKHLLWALILMKVYSTEEIHCSIVGWPHRETFRKWSWYFVKKIAGLKGEVIKLENRFKGLGATTAQNCFLSIDGTDCPIHEPWPFDGKWFSQKFNGPAVLYEVGICIQTGHICWVNGPHIGSANDGAVFKETLAPLLADEEGVEVDSGYLGNSKCKLPHMGLNSKARKQKSLVRARHENVNGRMKIFNVLDAHFRHMNPGTGVVGTDNKVKKMMEKHGYCFHAIAVITQLKFEAGEELFKTEYDVNYWN